MRLVYLCLAYLLVPIAAAVELARSIAEPVRRAHFGERFGFGPRLAPGAVWVHAVSMGEVQVAATLVRALRARSPATPVVLTASTATGRARAEALVGGDASVRYLPYDLPDAVARFFDRVRPSRGIVLETELWPSLYRAARRRGIPMTLASARLSERSVGRYRRLGRLFAETLAGVEVAAQCEADAARFREIGAARERVSVLGNLKFDYVPPPAIVDRARALREALGVGRPVWVAGSTHEGEEAAALEAHARLCERRPDALLVLAPRHPPRFPAVAELVARGRLPWQARSAGESPAAGTSVWLLDTLGELLAYYAAADVAYVGGSLVPVGGHNLLEPAAVGRPVLAGPHTFNDPAVARLLLEAGALTVVADAAGLCAAVEGFLGDPRRAHEAGERGRAAVIANQGALTRLLDRIGPPAAAPRIT